MDGHHHKNEESWHDGCRECYCHNGREMCALITCPVPACGNPTIHPGQCCPSCAGKSWPPSWVLHLTSALQRLVHTWTSGESTRDNPWHIFQLAMIAVSNGHKISWALQMVSQRPEKTLETVLLAFGMVVLTVCTSLNYIFVNVGRLMLNSSSPVH